MICIISEGDICQDRAAGLPAYSAPAFLLQAIQNNAHLRFLLFEKAPDGQPLELLLKNLFNKAEESSPSPTAHIHEMISRTEAEQGRTINAGKTP